MTSRVRGYDTAPDPASAANVANPGGDSLRSGWGDGWGDGWERAISTWLFVMAVLVFVMVMVGGATRLTGSGLSITEWQPILGAIPPLTEADWQSAFAKYKQIPQYDQLNKGMSLAAFKSIFWWEWGHRFLGRLLGIAFLTPLLYFVARGAIHGRRIGQMALLFVLGGAQGALGWYMVKSGLINRIDVSQYRLAAHLTFACVLFATLLWIALNITHGQTRRSPASVRLRTSAAGSALLAKVILAATFVQIFLGALVAGLKAGLTYNTWPLMDGRFIPNGLTTLKPLWHNVFENPTTVQFNHRIMAYLLTGLVALHAVRVMRSADDERTRRSVLLLATLVAIQVVLGIWTLLAVVPLHLALVHQATAVLVLAASIWHTHTLRQS